MTLPIFVDDFAAADGTNLVDHTPNYGDGWLRATGYGGSSSSLFIDQKLVVSSHANRIAYGDTGAADNAFIVVGNLMIKAAATAQKCGIVGRLNSPTDAATITFYALTWDETGGFRLIKRHKNQYGNYVEVDLDSVNPTVSDGLHHLYLSYGGDGETPTAYIRRASDGKWLKSDGTWTAAFQIAMAVADDEFDSGLSGIFCRDSYLDANDDQTASNIKAFSFVW